MRLVANIHPFSLSGGGSGGGAFIPPFYSVPFELKLCQVSGFSSKLLSIQVELLRNLTEFRDQLTDLQGQVEALKIQVSKQVEARSNSKDGDPNGAAATIPEDLRERLDLLFFGQLGISRSDETLKEFQDTKEGEKKRGYSFYAALDALLSKWLMFFDNKTSMIGSQRTGTAQTITFYTRLSSQTVSSATEMNRLLLKKW